MLYRIQPELFQKYPGYVRGLVIARRVLNIDQPIDEVARMLKGAQQTVRDRADLDPVSAHPRVAAWREAYRAFGAKPTDFPSSIEALVKRVRKGDDLPYINTLAALCNNVSLRHLITVGGHALDEVSPGAEIVLGFATGDEEFSPLGGGPLEHPQPGEVIFYVAPGRVMTRRWTWRQGEFSKLTRQTTQVVINIDGLPPVAREDAEMISAEVANLVTMYGGGATVEVKLLSEETPQVEL